MTNQSIERRTFLTTSVATVAALPLLGSTVGHTSELTQSATRKIPIKKRFPITVISSRNGLKSQKLAYEMAKAGKDTLDAAIACVTVVEKDPNDNSVGYGGLPNENGVVELDAAVMHGPTHRAGAVAALQNIKHPSHVAKKVLEETDHVLLVGIGALQFARAHGFQEVNLLTEKSRKIWLYWKQTHSDRDDWIAPATKDIDPDVAEFFKISMQRTASSKASKGSSQTALKKFQRPTGTIHCATMNTKGDISCVTTTSGLAFKIPGRVGDSPIIGAGLYVDNEVGSCGSTGRGEANLQNLCCSTAVELMRTMPPKEAGLEVLRRVAQHTTEKHLLRKDGRPNFGLKFYLLAKDGQYAGVTMWGPAEFAVTDAKGTRAEKCASLYKKS